MKQQQGPPANFNRSWTRLDGVDLLRGLAILFVLMNHINMRLLFAHVPYTSYLPAQVASSLVWNGQRGVQIFFAVSGFLITSTALRRSGSLSAVRVLAFYRLRFARIAPLLLALLTLLSLLHVAQVPNFIVSTKTGGIGRALLAALTFHINVLEASRGYLPGNWDILWSLSVEEIFYLGFPLACRLLRKKWLFSAVLLSFVVTGPFARTVLTHGNPVWAEYSYLGGMDAIAMGCLTALLLHRRKLSAANVRLCTIFGLILMAFILCFGDLTGKLGLERTGLDMSVVALGACLLIAASAATGWRGPRVLTPVLRLGQRSYEVYLTHMFVVFGCFALFVRIGKPMSAVPLLFIVVIYVSALLGGLVAKYYSEPMNRLLRSRTGRNGESLGSVAEESEPNSALETPAG